MQDWIRIAILGLAGVLADAAVAQQSCEAKPIADEQIKALAQRERERRAEVPPAFPEYKWSVQRQGCYYVYTELALPLTPDKRQVFTFDPQGVLVDVEDVALKCPEKRFSNLELQGIAAQARARRQDIGPSSSAESRVQVVRKRCLYQVFEYPLPEVRGRFDLFTIDPNGALMEFQRSSGY